MGANIALAVLGLITGSIVARLLGPSARGELAAIQSWAALLTTLGALGIPQAVVFYCGRSATTAGRTLGTGLLILAALSLPLMVLGYLLMPMLLAAQAPATVSAAQLYLTMIPLQFAAGLPLFALQGRSEIAVWNALRFVSVIGWLAVVVTAWFTGQTAPQYLAAGNIFVTAFSIIPVWIVATRWLHRPFAPAKSLVRPLIHFGLPAALANVPLVLNLRIDQLLMAAFLAPEVLGLYAIAVAWSSAISTLLGAVGNVTFPRLAAAENPDKAAQSLVRITRMSVALSLSLVGVFLVCSPLAIFILFGQSYLPAIPAAMILVIAAGVAGLNQVLEDGLRGAGQPAQVMFAEVAGLFVTVLLLMILLPSYQLVGAAIASLVSYLVVTAVLSVRIRYILHIPISDMFIPRSAEMASVWRHLLITARLRSNHD